jgi:hypothetical protein
MMEKTEIDCRRPLWSGTVRGEEMVDCVVPDTEADIARVVGVCPQLVIRGKSADEGHITVEAAVQCTALCTAEGSGALITLETEIPFVLTAEAPGADADTDIVAQLALEESEVRLLNPRKILARAEVSAYICCYGAGTMAVAWDIQPREGLQLRRESHTASVVTDVREKTFVITDEIAMPPAAEGYIRLLGHHISLSTGDVKFVGNKLIFKGEAALSILAEPERESRPVCFSGTISFSQILELAEEADSAELKLCLTGAYLQLAETEGGRSCVSAELHLLAQGVACVNREVRWIADAYSTGEQCALICETLSLPQQSAQSFVHDTWRCTLETEATPMEVICAQAIWGAAEVAEGTVTCRVNLRCMYADDQGMLRSAEKAERVRLDVEQPEGKVHTEMRCGEIYASAAAGGIDLRIPLEAVLNAQTELTEDCVTAISLEKPETAAERPSLYVVPTGSEADLWALAKRYGSTVELIRELNDEESAMLLIPVSR